MTNIDIKNEKQYIWEMIGVMIITVMISLLAGGYKGISLFIPLLYLFGDKIIRHRSWDTLGLKFKNTLKDLKQNGYLILLVGFVIPILTVMVSNLFMPEFFDHLRSRVPILQQSFIIPLFFSFLVGGFIEELVFRGLFQERLSWFLKTPVVLVLSAVIFSAAHFSPGSIGVVFFDLAGVFINAFIYSVIYHRSKNVFASWIAHFLSDSFALICVIIFTSVM